MQLPAISRPPSSPLQVSAKILVAPSNPTDPEAAIKPTKAADTTQTSEKAATNGEQKTNKLELTDTDYRIIAELKKTDRQVRAHEQAHLAAAGGLARGGASFGYTKGPDGQRYAVSGEVSIDTSPGANPEATLLKAQRIQTAALAPSQPSGADRAVASAASQMATSARAELLAQRLKPEDAEGSPNDYSKTETDLTKGKVVTDNRANGTEDTGAHETTPDASKDLVQLIKQVTSAGDALGNILNTAV